MNTKDIKFSEIVSPFDADPNLASPEVTQKDADVELKFDAYKKNKNNPTVASFLFHDCLMYRVGDPNDEGLDFISDPKLRNDSIYYRKNFPELKTNTFYNITGLDWKENLLGKGTIIVQYNYKEKEDYSHFIFFMKEGTFECVSKSYKIQKEIFFKKILNKIKNFFVN